jgi:hypothetical protein
MLLRGTRGAQDLRISGAPGNKTGMTLLPGRFPAQADPRDSFAGQQRCWRGRETMSADLPGFGAFLK